MKSFLGGNHTLAFALLLTLIGIGILGFAGISSFIDGDWPYGVGFMAVCGIPLKMLHGHTPLKGVDGIG